VNRRLVAAFVGRALQLEFFILILPIAVSLFYGEDASSFLITMVFLAVIGFPLSSLEVKNKNLRTRDGFAAVALTWIAISLFGALPFYFSGYITSLTDSFFEAVSGFTTTGATILAAPELLPKGLLFWRALTQFIGGMGILVFMMTMTSSSASSVNLLKAESTGPTPSKLVPKIRETARILYIIYFGLSAVLLLLLICCGLAPFDAILTTMCTAGTGGFAAHSLGIGVYGSLVAEIIVSIFMFLFGINFTLYFYLLRRNFKEFHQDEELRLYVGLAGVAIVLIARDIYPLCGSISEALRLSSFQVSGVISTAGYATANYSEWPVLSKTILMLLTLGGSSAGSTGGGLKLIRVLIIGKSIRLEIDRLLHPRLVRTVRLQGRNVPEATVNGALMFLCVYALCFAFFCLVMALEGNDLQTVVTSTLAIISNVGPGLGSAGPLGTFAAFSPLAKITLSFGMFVSRLEFYPMLLLFTPGLWRNRI